MNKNPRDVAPFDPIATKPAERRVALIGGVSFPFRYCPPGEFAMGDDEGLPWERPRRKVALTAGFWLMETQVTQRQWETITGSNPSQFGGGARPVETISWSECRAALAKLNEIGAAPDGWRFALPTEAQWERACRADASEFDSEKLDEFAWRRENSGKKTCPIALKKPNSWGFYDMLGNVWEWCEDYFGEYSNDAVIDPSRIDSGDDFFWGEDGELAWTKGAGAFRVARGGAWDCGRERCRPASRDAKKPDERYDNLGVRFALVQESSRSDS